MTDQELEILKYPIGRLRVPENIEESHLKTWQANLRQYPAKLESLIANLTDGQLDTPYRPNGWTVRQLLHHIPDSHTNAYIRFKWALTEGKPLIKAYFEDKWSALPDSLHGDIKPALGLLYAVHARWDLLMKSMSDEDWEKSFIHPETNKELTLKFMLGLYNWHSAHHYAHVERLIQREGW